MKYTEYLIKFMCSRF